MQESGKAIWLATCAVLADAGGKRFLVDGMIGEKGHPFSVLPKEAETALMEGRAPYADIDYLMFTHLHPDHFDCDLTIEFLQRHPVRGVLLPLEESNETMRKGGIRLRRYMIQSGIPYRLLRLPIGQNIRYRLDGFEVTAFNTGHMGEAYAAVNNYCYLLQTGGTSVLFTGFS